MQSLLSYWSTYTTKQSLNIFWLELPLVCCNSMTSLVITYISLDIDARSVQLVKIEQSVCIVDISRQRDQFRAALPQLPQLECPTDPITNRQLRKCFTDLVIQILLICVLSLQLQRVLNKFLLCVFPSTTDTLLLFQQSNITMHLTDYPKLQHD